MSTLIYSYTELKEAFRLVLDQAAQQYERRIERQKVLIDEWAKSKVLIDGTNSSQPIHRSDPDTAGGTAKFVLAVIPPDRKIYGFKTITRPRKPSIYSR